MWTASVCLCVCVRDGPVKRTQYFCIDIVSLANPLPPAFLSFAAAKLFSPKNAKNKFQKKLRGAYRLFDSHISEHRYGEILGKSRKIILQFAAQIYLDLPNAKRFM